MADRKALLEDLRGYAKSFDAHLEKVKRNLDDSSQHNSVNGWLNDCSKFLRKIEEVCDRLGLENKGDWINGRRQSLRSYTGRFASPKAPSMSFSIFDDCSRPGGCDSSVMCIGLKRCFYRYTGGK